MLSCSTNSSWSLKKKDDGAEELGYEINIYIYIATFLLHSTGPPVNVTCNIFINSFGSVTETTMVSVAMPLAQKQQPLKHVISTTCQFCFLFIVQLAGPPVNVTCNIFINSFGSIAETTMVSGTDH